MIFKWLDSDVLFTIDEELTQFRNGETYEVDPETKPELTRMLRIKERQRLVEFINLEGIATFEGEVKPLDLGTPGELVEGLEAPTKANTPEPAQDAPTASKKSTRRTTEEA